MVETARIVSTKTKTMKTSKNYTAPSTTTNSTMTFEEYVIFDKKCSAPANLQWKDRVIENPITELDNEINNMIEKHHRLTCLINFDRMYKRDKKFGPYVDLIPKSNSVKIFPQSDNQINHAKRWTNDLNIGLKLLVNLQMKKIIK